MKTGLTIGKFAPFHKGHQYLIEQALKEVDTLIIIVYDAPKLTSIPLDVRANWIRKLYPQTTVIEGWHVPQVSGWSEENQQKHEQFVLSLLNGTEIHVFFSSEHYGERMSRTLKCENRIIDMDRNNISISATEIRINAYQYRSFLDPLVYRDFVANIAVMCGREETRFHLIETLSRHYQTIHTSCIKETLVDCATSSLFKAHMHEIESLSYEANRFLFIDANFIQICESQYTQSENRYLSEVTSLYDLVLRLDDACSDETLSQFITLLDGFEKYSRRSIC